MNANSICKAILYSIVAIGLSGGAANAASGSIDREDRVVYIEGDQWRDECRIVLDGDDIEIDLWVFDADGEEDDHDDKRYDLEDVDLIVFRGGAGDDDFRNLTSVPCDAFGGAGDDILLGGEGDDNLHGGADDDLLYGYGGDDDLFGDGGSDRLWGGANADYLKAGTGENETWILGGTGPDTFAVPVRFNWATRLYEPLDRSVEWEDFDPTEDVERWFIAPVLFTPMRTRF